MFEGVENARYVDQGPPTLAQKVRRGVGLKTSACKRATRPA
jgi:hypothetical protein